MRLKGAVLMGVAGFAEPAKAHLSGSAALTPAADISLWAPDPVAVILLLLAAWVYRRGSRAHPGQAGAVRRKRARCFWGGWWALLLVLASPIDPLGEVLFSVHMVQHEIVMLIAAPLLVASRPTAVLLRGLPRRLTELIGTGLRTSGAATWTGWMASPLAAWFIHALGLWGWHLPVLFNAGLRHTGVHALQHLTFLWIALIFWFALMKPKQSAPAANVLYLFTTAIHASLLGALLTFSPRVWYTPYLSTAPDWGLTALEDQQLGGLIMWMPAGIVFVLAGLVSLAGALQRGGNEAAGRREGL